MGSTRGLIGPFSNIYLPVRSNFDPVSLAQKRIGFTIKTRLLAHSVKAVVFCISEFISFKKNNLNNVTK